MLVCFLSFFLRVKIKYRCYNKWSLISLLNSFLSSTVLTIIGLSWLNSHIKSWCQIWFWFGCLFLFLYLIFKSLLCKYDHPYFLLFCTPNKEGTIIIFDWFCIRMRFLKIRKLFLYASDCQINKLRSFI